MRSFVAFLVGFLFAIGLGISGMTNPQKIISFLDITGQWDPSLIFVMGGALMVGLLTYRFILKRQKPLLNKDWSIPKNKSIDSKLIVGSLVFGIGWGLGGFCPGPAITALGFGSLQVLTFVAAMICGMVLFKVLHTYFIKWPRKQLSS